MANPEGAKALGSGLKPLLMKRGLGVMEVLQGRALQHKKRDSFRIPFFIACRKRLALTFSLRHPPLAWSGPHYTHG